MNNNMRIEKKQLNDDINEIIGHDPDQKYHAYSHHSNQTKPSDRRHVISL